MKAPKTDSLAVQANATPAEVPADAPVAPEVPRGASEAAPVVAPVQSAPEGDAPAPPASSELLEVPSEEAVQALRPCDLSIKPVEDSELLSVTHLPSGEVREMTREELNQLLRG